MKYYSISPLVLLDMRQVCVTNTEIPINLRYPREYVVRALKIKLTYVIAPHEEPRVVGETVDISDATIRGLLGFLISEYGARIEKFVLDPVTGTVREGILITVNNRDIRGLDGIETTLKIGDRVAFLPPIGGG